MGRKINQTLQHQSNAQKINHMLNPANLKIKAVESSEYENQAQRPVKLIFQSKENPMDKQGNSKSDRQFNKKSIGS